MTDASLPSARFAERDFRAGEVFNRTFTVLSRNLLLFGIVAGVAAVPNALLFTPGVKLIPSGIAGGVVAFVGIILMLVLGALSQATLLYGAFDDMRGRRVNLTESARIGLRRLFPVIGTALCAVLLAALAFIALIVPGLIVTTMLFVAMPACVVERLGPIKSMGRSARLTKGHRWRVFGIWVAAAIVNGIAESMLQGIAAKVGGTALAVAVTFAWSTAYYAFSAILAVVTYHDLRVAKEGVDTDQIASVFD